MSNIADGGNTYEAPTSSARVSIKFTERGQASWEMAVSQRHTRPMLRTFVCVMGAVLLAVGLPVTAWVMGGLPWQLVAVAMLLETGAVLTLALLAGIHRHHG